MLDPKIKLGTSTPRNDPAGDYAWEVFHKADALEPGSFVTLEQKALRLVGGPDVPVPADVLDACVRVLAGWGWTERPVGVVGIGSRTRPHQLDHLARRIAVVDPVGDVRARAAYIARVARQLHD